VPTEHSKFKSVRLEIQWKFTESVSVALHFFQWCYIFWNSANFHWISSSNFLIDAILTEIQWNFTESQTLTDWNLEWGVSFRRSLWGGSTPFVGERIGIQSLNTLPPNIRLSKYEIRDGLHLAYVQSHHDSGYFRSLKCSHQKNRLFALHWKAFKCRLVQRNSLFSGNKRLYWKHLSDLFVDPHRTIHVINRDHLLTPCTRLNCYSDPQKCLKPWKKHSFTFNSTQLFEFKMNGWIKKKVQFF